MKKRLTASEREAGREEMELVNDMLGIVTKKLFDRENKCHELGVSQFDDPKWGFLKGEQESLLDRKYGIK